jgi:signal transduction histidine kinase
MAGKCLINMAIIATSNGDYFEGQKLSLNAIPYFNSDSSSHLVYIRSNYNTLGIATASLNQHLKAIDFYQTSLAFTQDSLAAFVIQNNIANAYQKAKDYPKALAIYQSLLAHQEDLTNYARVLANFAYTQWLQNPEKNIAPLLIQSLGIRQQLQDLLGQNTTFNYLGDFYQNKNPDSALFYTQKMYALSSRLNLPDERLKALEKLVKLSDGSVSKSYFNKYQNLSDSIQTARNISKNQFALIRYETEKHKADNLKLQKEKTERNSLITCLVIFIAVSFVGYVIYYQKRKEKLALAAEKAIKESQLKTSKKVHDVVANGLYRLLSAIENNGEIDQEKLLDDIEILYEQSRDISYEQKPLEEMRTQYPVLINNLLSSFASEKTKILISGNSNKNWEQVSIQQRLEVLQMLQELMVNMKKHSEASRVALRFEQQKKQFNLHYKDNGKGLPANYKMGNGLTNTGNRINGLAGMFTFGNHQTGGLEIDIHFPTT